MTAAYHVASSAKFSYRNAAWTRSTTLVQFSDSVPYCADMVSGLPPYVDVAASSSPAVSLYFSAFRAAKAEKYRKKAGDEEAATET